MTKYVFVNDFFVEEYIGGAELTSESLINACPDSIRKLKSSKITNDILIELKDYVWIFGNFTEVPHTSLMKIIKRNFYLN